MALVNVGIQLAKTHRKVLLVDFDLEAPGLPTFPSLKHGAGDSQGLVEYVSHYTSTGEVADISNYLYKSERFPGGGELWIMPAGMQGANYSSKLNSIDWRKLYSEQSGYLFFEDLKRQWNEAIKPDYVLIDSRTGHSDVEGICTRQLPNAVTLLFFPNEQNLYGLKRIVSSINGDNAKVPGKNIRIHFAVSNVPDLDDEDRILVKTMQRFKKELGYKELSAEIHHYNSLALINQDIFSLTHPNSRLAKEYTALTKSITKYNLEDREAALNFLTFAQRNFQAAMYEDSLVDFNKKLSRIQTRFSRDGEMLYKVSLVLERLGNTNDALSILSSSIVAKGYPTASVYAAKVRLYHSLGDTEKVIENLKGMLNAGKADITSLLETTPLIEQLAPDLFELMPNSRALASLNERDKEILALQLEGGEEQAKAKQAILRQLTSTNSENEEQVEYLTHESSLLAIRLGDFEDAIQLLNPKAKLPEDLEISQLFNLAMAFWGKNGKPTQHLFQLVIQKDLQDNEDQGLDPNYLQCISICYAVLGDKESAYSYLAKARKALTSRNSREFSAWTYSRVPPKDFATHLDELEKFIGGSDVTPRYMYRPSC